MSYPKYYDGLDADGYPLNEPWRIPYTPGSEAEIGEFKPVAIGNAFDMVVERAFAAMRASRNADSPIESILGAAIILKFKHEARDLTLATEPTKAVGLLLIPQFKWSIYRSDWAIFNPKTTGALLIECDGKDFHSSPEQVSHDARKDQAAHDTGYLTMRFTGSRIHRDADGCAAEIFDFVHGGRK